VRVIHLEAVADPLQGQFPPQHFPPRRGDLPGQHGRGGAAAHAAAAAAGTPGAAAAAARGGGDDDDDDNVPSAANMFADSVESLMRNVIQASKIAMANEVIDAGQFDQETTDDQRRKKLEQMLLVRCGVWGAWSRSPQRLFVRVPRAAAVGCAACFALTRACTPMHTAGRGPPHDGQQRGAHARVCQPRACAQHRGV
jgi:hypothetical protein